MDATLIDAMRGVVLEGRYRIDERLAEGGMSTVYAGVDLRLDRRVAIKVMTPSLGGNQAFVDRFTREARAAARLSHINVVSVFDQGTDGTHAFLVMELVQGHTLRDLLVERGRLSPAEALAVLEPVLAGLTAAHRTGLVHRDIKPENVLISQDGVVKVADFGLARAVAAGSAATRSGDVLIGTVAYLSPEQVESGTATPRSDVYSAGILLYEMLTGAPPYSGETAISIAYRHVHSDVPSPSLVTPDLPPALDALTVAATRRAPSARPLDAGSFLAELWDVRTDLGLDRVPVPLGQRRRGTGTATAHGTARMSSAGASAPPRMAKQTRPVARSTGKRRARSRWLTLLVVLTLGLTAGGAGWWFGSGRYTDVPELVALTEDAAITAAQRAHVDLVFTEAVFSETVADGVVISTEPAGGDEVVRGTDVAVTVSKGPERFVVEESLIGRPLQEVRDALADVPVAKDEREAYDEQVPAGFVAGFEPPAGTPLRRDQPLVTVVSRGPAPVDVPEVVGETREDAIDTLREGGLNPNAVEEFSNDVAEGLVISQSPEPAAGKVARNTTVRIAISKGPDLVEVPDVDDLLLSEATAILEGAGFVVRATCFLCSDGQVSRVSPGAGELVLRGSTIDVLATF
ncbi:MAG: Stk1 family PASTA domain-containing Ser/Thr kinase [Actinomycetota bacterium]|nr:Stk1 family PASTA domain-containing Ser/Thr kinase [Actinomycetota bacterium]